MKIKPFLCVLGAVAALSPPPAAAQDVPPGWIDGALRDRRYPPAEWYRGVLSEKLRDGANLSDAQKRLTRAAQTQMAEEIALSMTGASAMSGGADIRQRGKAHDEVSTVKYREVIRTSLDVKVVGVENRHYYDRETGTLHVFAAVRRSTLASYYASRIEAGLGEAQRGIDLAGQDLKLDRKREALTKLAESVPRVDSTVYYRDLLVAVDPENGLKRAQSDRADRMRKEIAAMRAEAEKAMRVFVFGTETIQGKPASVVTEGLYTALSGGGAGIAKNRGEADFIIEVEAEACDRKYDGDFHYASACVKVTLTNVKTGAVEVSASVKCPKKGGSTPRQSEEAALKAAVPEIWAMVKERIII